MFDEIMPSEVPTSTHRSSRRWGAATAAGLLSLLIAGMGQLYNRQPRKALCLAVPIPIAVIVAAQTTIFFSFIGMVTMLVVLTGWRLFIAGEAAYDALSSYKPEAALAHPRLTYPLIAAALLAAALYPSTDQFRRWSSFGAFKVPSSSMCPTICLGERVVADMGAYKSKPPERGDLVLFKHSSASGLFIKRVIGIAGDVVELAPNGAILVNGKPVVFPGVCGAPIQEKGDSSAYQFQSTRVPEGAFFVIGDNLPNSYDSRFPGFGPVVDGVIRGKPVYIYWSPNRSRIGCPTH